jgi:hypothetical protein
LTALTTNKCQSTWKLKQTTNLSNEIDSNIYVCNFEISAFQELEQEISARQVFMYSKSNSIQYQEEDENRFNVCIELQALNTMDKSNVKEMLVQESLLNYQSPVVHNTTDVKFQVDALNELRFEGEWEELILPSSNFQDL